MEKLNIAELLRHCPKDMELNCMMYEDVYFDYISDCDNFIYCYVNYEDRKTSISFNKYGAYSNLDKSKCVIFPKGKTTWEGFVPPCKFKDGDIIYVKECYNWICIYKETENTKCLYKYVSVMDSKIHTNTLYGVGDLCRKKSIGFVRLATEEEKQILFDAIKAKGYRWNAETKTLEKIQPKFKVGDRIQGISTSNYYTVVDIKNGYYFIKADTVEYSYLVSIDHATNYRLVPNKFDITTLKPFDKVLVRNSNKGRWVAQFYTLYDFKEEYPFECVYNCWKYCIPYKGNEHLLDTTNDCDDFYKTWE